MAALKETYDCLVVGAGLAGLQCARLLGGHGLSVLLVDRKPSLDQAIHTTGIFPRRTLEDFGLPPAYLGPPIRHVTLYSPSRRQQHLESPHEEFRVARMGELYARLLKDCQAAGVEWLASAQYVASERAEGGSLVRLRVGSNEQSVFTRFIVAADGANSRVAADLGLSVNRRWLIGLEEVFTAAPLDGPPRLHCFLDHRLAPGYIAWIAEDGQSLHVGVGGQAARFQPAQALTEFRWSLGSIVDLSKSTLIERRGGRIPIGGILPNIANARGLSVGDAAGAVSPLTAGGLDPCMRLSELGASVAFQYLKSGDQQALAAYDGASFRRRFRARRLLRTGLSWAAHNWALEAMCAVLRTGPGERIARQIFFGHGSFPDRVPRADRTVRPAKRSPLTFQP